MEQINIYGIFLLGKWLDSAFLHAKMPISANAGAWQAARGILDILLTGDAKMKLKESRNAGMSLLGQLDGILQSYAVNPNHVMNDTQVQSFNNVWAVFEQALAIDL